MCLGTSAHSRDSNVSVVEMSEQQDLRIAGISLDCPDPALLAAFYAEVLGGRALWTNADSADAEANGVVLIAQRVSDYVPPTWPGTSVIHLDLAAGLDLEASVAFAVASGAKKTAYQPDPRWCISSSSDPLPRSGSQPVNCSIQSITPSVLSDVYVDA